MLDTLTLLISVIGMDLSHFYDSQAKLSKLEIEALEKRCNIILHSDHRNLLSICNGGQTDKCISTFKNNNGVIEKCCLNWLLSISDDEYDNLETYIRRFKLDKKRLPDNLLPIANDPGGNLFCISTDGFDRGNIYFWEHEFEVEDGLEPDYSNVFFVANSIEEFIDSLV